MKKTIIYLFAMLLIISANAQTSGSQAVKALPTQLGHAGKYLTTNGTVATWSNVSVGASSSTLIAGNSNLTITQTGQSFTLTPKTPTLSVVNGTLSGSYPTQTLTIPSSSSTFTSGNTNLTITQTGQSFTLTSKTPTLSVVNGTLSGTYPTQTLTIPTSIMLPDSISYDWIMDFSNDAIQLTNTDIYSVSNLYLFENGTYFNNTDVSTGANAYCGTTNDFNYGSNAFMAVELSGFTMYSEPYLIVNNGSNNSYIVNDGNNSKGIVYFDDYSTNFTPESLVSKRYVDAQFIKQKNNSVSIPITALNTTTSLTITVSDAKVGDNVTANSRANLPNGMNLSHCYVSSSNTVTLRFTTSVATVSATASVFDITILK